MIKNNDNLFKNSLGSQVEDDSLLEDLFFLKDAELIDPKLVAELVDKGVKFNNSDLLFVTKDQSGQIVFLEKGNKIAGLEHILYGDGTPKDRGHLNQFIEKFHVDANNVHNLIYYAVKNGEIVGKRKSRPKKEVKTNTIKNTGFDYVFKIENKYLMVTISNNGFIVTSHPIDKGEIKRY